MIINGGFSILSMIRLLYQNSNRYRGTRTWTEDFTTLSTWQFTTSILVTTKIQYINLRKFLFYTFSKSFSCCVVYPFPICDKGQYTAFIIRKNFIRSPPKRFNATIVYTIFICRIRMNRIGFCYSCIQMLILLALRIVICIFLFSIIRRIANNHLYW